MPNLKTEESLLAALREASSGNLSAEEIDQQRVSFIMGTVGSSSGITRARVEEVLAEQKGKRR